MAELGLAEDDKKRDRVVVMVMVEDEVEKDDGKIDQVVVVVVMVGD